MENIETLLNKEIESELTTLEDMSMGDENMRISIDGLTKLLDRQIEYEKMKFDNELKLNKQTHEMDSKDKELELREKELEMQEKELERQNRETALKEKQVKDERIDKIVKNCLTGVSVIGGFALTVWGTCKSIKFEETGTITTIMGRGFINKLLHKN